MPAIPYMSAESQKEAIKQHYKQKEKTKDQLEMYLHFAASEVYDGGIEIMALRFKAHMVEFLELLKEKVILTGTDVIRVHVTNSTLNPEVFAEVTSKEEK